MNDQVFGFYADLRGLQFTDGNASWIHAMTPGEYIHGRYGKINITADRIRKFADSVAKNVRGIPLDIDYDHKAHTGEAAGWVKQADVRPDGLWLFVDWTATAAQKIKEGAYRFFSPEFLGEWSDAQGAKHEDVMFGGGITNRPFLKNLLPLNLSELSFGPEPPVPPVPPVPPTKEKEVDLKLLAEKLGLPADSSEEVVLLKLGERLATPAPPTPPTPVLQLSEDIRKLAESNPTAKGLVDMVEALMRTDADKATQLREQIITTKLGEFDRSGLALTPVAKDLMHDIAIKMDDADLGTKFWELMTMMRDAQGVMVELGERGRSGSQYMREKSPTIQFDEEVQRLVTGAEKVALPDAMERVAKENPALYAAYRNDTYIAGGSVSNNG